MQIDFKVIEKVGDLKYKLEVYSEDAVNFRVSENDSRYHEYNSREQFAKDFPEASNWIFGNG